MIVNGSVGTFGGCTVAAPQITCSIKSLNAGGTMDVTITGQVITSAGSTIFNTATVTGKHLEQGRHRHRLRDHDGQAGDRPDDHQGGLSDPVCAASWPGPGGVCQGGLTYTFVVGNSGTQQATGVVVRDPLPAGLIYVPSKTTAPDFSAAARSTPATSSPAPAARSARSRPRPSASTSLSPPTIGTITNTVTVDPNNAIFEADETNNTFTQVTTVGTGIDLTIAKHSNHEANFVATRGTLKVRADPIADLCSRCRGQTTSGMGVYPNDDGQKCISDSHLGGRHDRSWRHAAQMEAERARSTQLEHLPVVVLLSGLRQVLPRAGLIYCPAG